MLMLVAALLTPGLTSAQQSKATNLVTHGVDTLRVATLANHHPLWANQANDLGALAAEEPVGPFTLMLGRTAERQMAFEQLLADQQNPASSEYHHWLTSDEIGSRFGVSDSDLDAVAGWLVAENLQVTYVANSRVFIRFSGTAANINQAFGTELHRYSVNGSTMLSVSTEPTIPEALLPAVQLVRGLYEIGEHPMHTASVQISADPNLTTSGGNHYVTPKDFATIYNLPASYTGAGFTVGIVAEARINPADLNNYKSLTQTTFTNPAEVVPTGGTDPGAACTTATCNSTYLGAQGEATLDAMRVGSVAPGASMLLVVTTSGNGGGIGADAEYMIDTTPVPVQAIDISWGACESAIGNNGVTYWDSLFSTGAAEGISVFVSSGDSGASGCLSAFVAPGTQTQLSPNYICSSSYVTCVGATQFNDTASPSTYWSASNSAGYASALGYIPEGAWNESTASSVAGTGGGVSNYIAKPTWQTGTGVPGSTGRYTPDVSFSGSIHDGYFGCMAAEGGGCTGSPFYFMSFGGTSASAPEMAGVAALVDQKLHAAQGNMNPKIYELANSTNYSSIFNDATVTSSGVGSCSASTISLCNNTAVGTAPGYTLNAGFDQATGWGSLNIANFLSNYTSQSAPTVTVTLGASSITVGQTLGVTVTVSGSGATPTGSVVLSGGGYTSSATTLTAGSATFNIGAGVLSLGSDTLTATYAPDAGSTAAYTSATGSKSVTVTSKFTPTVAVTPAASPITVGQTLSVTVTVSGTSGTPTGSVVLSGGGYTSAATTLTAGSATINLAAGALNLGSDTLTATYTPDAGSTAVYTSATGSNSVTVTAKLTPTVTVTTGANNITVGQTLSVTVAVSGTGATPTGSVILSGGGYTSSATTLTAGSATFNITAGALAMGTDTLTANYTPDSGSSPIYLTGSGTKSVTVSLKYTPTVTVTPALSSVAMAQALSVTVAVSGSSGTATGSVVLTSGSYTSSATALASGSTTISVPAGSLALGSDTLTATYTPDANSTPVYNGATGTNTVTVTANYTPTVTVTPGASSITVGQTLAVSVAVTGAGGTATGSVVLAGGGYTSAATTLSGGNATINIAAGALALGTDTLTATYTPDAGSSTNYSSASGSNTVTVTPKLMPTVTVTTGANSITVGQTLSVTVAVSGTGATPTGSVILSSGGYTSAATTLTGGSATINIAAGVLAQGSDTLNANYTPDGTSSPVYLTASGTKAVTVTAMLMPTVTVTPGASSITVSQTLSVTVAVSGTGATPTGSVILSGGGYTSVATTLTSGSATINIAAGALALGNDTLTANFTPDGTSSPIYLTASGTGSVTVTKATPTVTVTPAAGSITVIQQLSVTVAVSGSSGTPSGTVTLTSGSYSSGAVTLTSGSATINIAAGALALGTDTLTATYTPDAGSSSKYNGASGTNTVTVSKVTPAVTVTPNPASITTVQSTQVTVAVSGGSGAPITTGSVVVSGGGYTSSATTLSSGSATITIPAGTFVGGSITLTAAYTPDANSTSTYNSASGTGGLTVTVPVPTLTGISPGFTSAGGASFTITATGTNFISTSAIYWGATALAPTGNQSATSLSATVPAALIASAGQTAVKVVSTSGAATAQSSTLQFEVDSASSGSGPVFTPVTFTVTAGSTAGYRVTLPASATNVFVTCLNLPTGASCSYSASAGTLTITTSASTPVGTYQITVVFTETLPGASLILIPLLLLPLAAARRRWKKAGIMVVLCLGLAVAAVAGISGCGGGTGGGGSSTPLTHTVTSSGSITLIVQ